jgi:hypothetical protein
MGRYVCVLEKLVLTLIFLFKIINHKGWYIYFCIILTKDSKHIVIAILLYKMLKGKVKQRRNENFVIFFTKVMAWL